MFICSLRFSRWKLVLCCTLLLAALVALGLLPSLLSPKTAPVSLPLQSQKVSSNDDRVQYLLGCGWEVEPEPEAIEEIVVPEDFGEIFQQYNQLQQEQGFDLSRQKGQRLKRYTYVVLNYPNEPDYVRANLLICKNKVVGGDICSLRVQGGFLHGLRDQPQEAEADPS